MMPVNAQIQAIAAGDGVRAPYVDKLIEAWRVKHTVRMILGGIAYVCAILLRETI